MSYAAQPEVGVKAADWLETGVVSSVDGFGYKGITKFTDKLAKTLKPYSGRDVSETVQLTQELQQQVTTTRTTVTTRITTTVSGILNAWSD